MLSAHNEKRFASLLWPWPWLFAVCRLPSRFAVAVARGVGLHDGVIAIATGIMRRCLQ
jgi:hypothetical protein